MPKVIIVEDEESHSKALVRLCSRYQQERGVELDTAVYDNPAVFLQKYHGDADMVLLDILMPQMNGMECARRLRKRDENVLLCFVTSMAQYAIQGYEVGAVDFILKPVNYDEFSLKMDRMLRILRKQSSATVLVSTRSEMKKIDLRDLAYVGFSTTASSTTPPAAILKPTASCPVWRRTRVFTASCAFLPAIWSTAP